MARKRVDTRRGRKRNLVKKTTKQLQQQTQSIRRKQNKSGKSEFVDSSAIIRNKQLIFKYQTRAQTPGKGAYTQTIIAHKVDFVDEKDPKHPLRIELPDGTLKYAEKLVKGKHPVSVICSCPDFRFMWGWWLARDKALVGQRPKPYTRKTPLPPKGYPLKNPTETSGLCKHIDSCLKHLNRNKIMTG